MIAGKFRFHGRAALKFLFGKGKTYRFKNVSIRVAVNSRRVHSRLAVVVGKKVLKAAPKRNVVRRRIFEIMRIHWDHIAPGHDILLSVHNPNILDMPHEQLTDEIVHACREARIWVDAPVVLEKL